MFDDTWLYTYYQTNYELVYKHNFMDIEKLDNMIPFEREIYLDLLNQDLKEKVIKQKQQKNNG